MNKFNLPWSVLESGIVHSMSQECPHSHISPSVSSLSDMWFQVAFILSNLIMLSQEGRVTAFICEAARSLLQYIMTWRQELYIWACTIFYARLVSSLEGFVWLTRSSKPEDSSLIHLLTQARDPGRSSKNVTTLAVSWAMYDPAMAKCGPRMSRHSTRHGTRRPIPSSNQGFSSSRDI